MVVLVYHPQSGSAYGSGGGSGNTQERWWYFWWWKWCNHIEEYGTNGTANTRWTMLLM